MIRTAMRVLGRVVGGLVAVSLLVHVLVALLPGDAASVIAGPAADPEAVDDLRAQMGLDRPAPVAWWEWASSALVGDLGTSLMTGRPVIDTLSARVANSFLIALPAWVISVVVGTWIAGIAALGRPRWVSAVTVAVCGIPEAVVVIGLVILLGVWLHVLPAISLVPLGESPLSDPRVLVLPIIALAVPSAAWMARMLRGPAADVARRPDVRDAQDRGGDCTARCWRSPSPRSPPRSSRWRRCWRRAPWQVRSWSRSCSPIPASERCWPPQYPRGIFPS